MGQTETLKAFSKGSSDDLLNALGKWWMIEDETIDYSKSMTAKHDNPIIKLAMAFLRLDSMKHKALLGMLEDSLTKEAMHLSYDELSELYAGLSVHLEAEETIYEQIDEMLKDDKTFEHRFISSMIGDNRDKYEKLFAHIEEVKSELNHRC